MMNNDFSCDFDFDIDFGEEEKAESIPADIEGEAKKQLSDTHKKAKEERHGYEKRMKFEGDMDYFFSIVFRSKKERDSFLESRGISLVDNGQYIFYDDVKSYL
jgi:chromatin segregation and condensation protein Rec8/ScpA/Scc1 (kleisin family)